MKQLIANKLRSLADGICPENRGVIFNEAPQIGEQITITCGKFTLEENRDYKLTKNGAIK